jgi:hypothetical protein
MVIALPWLLNLKAGALPDYRADGNVAAIT